MKRNPFNKYLAFVKGGVLGTFSYKFSILGWILGDFIQVIIICSLWIAVFNSSPTEEINGFTLPSMLTYLISIRIVSHLVYSSESFWQIGEDIRKGSIANQLIRPISYRRRLLSTDIGNFIGSFIIAFIPLYTISIFVLHYAFGADWPTWYNIILFLISSFASLLIYASANFIIGQAAFFTGALFGIGIIKDELFTFLSGGLIPISFFPSWAQTVLKFLPFSSMLETPNFISLGYYTPIESLLKILIQFGWVIIFGIIAELTFKKSVKHLVSTGG